MDPTEPHWRTNSSFSPPPSRIWDCRVRSDGISHGTHAVHISGSSVSSHSKGTRRMSNDDQDPEHHHAVFDGGLSYFGSPPDNLQAPRWTPPARRYDLGEFSTPTGGAKPQNSRFAECNERSFAAGASSVPNSLSSASPPPESSQLASTGKQPIFFPPRNFSGRRSFMSKPVYPLIFRNPVSEGEDCGPSDASISTRMTPSPTELHQLDTSPEPSRREGFRWSNASSYDSGFDGDTIDISEHIGLEILKSPNKCGLCGRFMWQKSPWSTHRIVTSGDMPIAGVLPCRHVFHADCLEDSTPRGELHEPPCPVCLKTSGSGGSASFSEPLNLDQDGGGLRRNQSLPMLRRGGSLIKNHFKRRFFSKGKMAKDLFGVKKFRGAGSSSSSSLIRENVSQPGGSRARHSSRLSGLK